MHELIASRPTGLGTSAARFSEELRTSRSLGTNVEEVTEIAAAAVTSGPLARLLAGPPDLVTRATRISGAWNAPDRTDSELHGSPPVRIDEPLGREINAMLMSWAESIGLYPGHLDYLEACDFGRYAMLTHPNTDDRDRLFLVGQSMIALFALDDYYVDDKRSGATLDQVGRNLSLCMSALDVPFLTDKYDDDTAKGIEADPVLVSLR